MSETWLNLGSQVSAAKAVIKTVSGRPGVGVAQLIFSMEITTKDDASRDFATQTFRSEVRGLRVNRRTGRFVACCGVI
jgi:hypothetical protein